MLAPDSDTLALIGACGDSSQVVSLGLSVACLALSGTKSDAVGDKFKLCIRFTKETQVELQKYYDCVCHDIERLQAHQRLHDVFIDHTLQLQNLLDESKATKASTFLGRARNACSKAMPSLDKRYRKVSDLKKGIERHMDEVKARIEQLSTPIPLLTLA
ncbi:hypothetical protein VNI00_008525 [Paramarasmius palmivorus]|uniref:Uncharacterized protein n=1 Tax=Paramarasmius palmivorus TaxID=297713 RepID=A0AAW0CTK7_9AGAR